MTRETLNTLGLALVLGGLFAASPLTSHRRIPSLLGGMAVAGAVVAYRRLRTRAAAAPAEDGTPSPVASASRTPPSVWLCLLLFGVAFAPTIAFMFRVWTSSIWTNSHGIFVPFAMLYLGYEALKHESSTEKQASAWGFPFVVAGLGLAVVDAVLRTRYLSSIGLVVCLPGLSLLLLGRHRTRVLHVPLLLAIFMIPIPPALWAHIHLRKITAVGVEPLVEWLGFAAYRSGTAIAVPSGTFVVSDACSGFSTLYAAVALSLVLTCYVKSFARRLVLLPAGVALALASNIVRTLILILLVDRFGAGLLNTPIHEASGVATFWLVLGLLVLLAGPRELRRAVS